VLLLVLAGALEWYPGVLIFAGFASLAVSHVLTPCEDQITKWWRERLKNHGLLVLALLLVSAAALAEPRPAIRGASSLRVGNYGAPSVVLEGAKLRAILDELNQLRRRDWQRGETKLSCYSTLLLSHGKKRVGEYRVTFGGIVERPVDKGQGTYSLAISEADITELARLLREIAPPKDCN